MLYLVVGTRPEIIKMAPIILELRDRGLPHKVLHTGQHYDRPMSDIFFEELGLPKPDHFLKVGSGTHGQQTAQAMLRIEEVLLRVPKGVVVVQGDTNTTLAAGLVGAKFGMPVVHVEAGLRSWDFRMPEEYNRRLVDHLASLLLAPTEHAASNLVKESVWGTVLVTGNTVLDACRLYMKEAERRSRILESLPSQRYILATLHRAENVDDPAVLAELVRILTGAPEVVVYPAHPRTVRRLRAKRLLRHLSQSENVKLLEPVGYFDFLMLMRNALCILTDSGGIQEEATSPEIHRKTFVLRRSTERPEAVASGFAQLVGTSADQVLGALKDSPWDPPSGALSPYGDGRAAARVVDALEDMLVGEVPTLESLAPELPPKLLPGATPRERRPPSKTL